LVPAPPGQGKTGPVHVLPFDIDIGEAIVAVPDQEQAVPPLFDDLSKAVLLDKNVPDIIEQLRFPQFKGVGGLQFQMPVQIGLQGNGGYFQIPPIPSGFGGIGGPCKASGGTDPLPIPGDGHPGPFPIAGTGKKNGQDHNRR